MADNDVIYLLCEAYFCHFLRFIFMAVLIKGKFRPFTFVINS